MRAFSAKILGFLILLSTAQAFAQDVPAPNPTPEPTTPEPSPAPAPDPQPETPPEPPPPPPFTEEQILRTIARVGYLKDSQVINFGIKYLERILEKMDLSAREDLKAALISVITASGEAGANVSNEARHNAAKALGHAKLTSAASAALIPLILPNDQGYAEEACVEFAKTTKTIPSADLIDAMKNLQMYTTLSDIAHAAPDKPLITYLVGVAKAESNYDFLYGLDGLDAADAVVENFLNRINKPAVPTDLSLTLSTYHSVLLQWKDNSTTEENFVLERSVNDREFTELGRPAANQIYWSDADVSPRTKYTYRVRAMSAAQSLTEYSEATITMPDAPDPLPDPIPPVPAIPNSPKPGIKTDELTKRMILKVEDRPHLATFEALIKMVKDGAPAVAVESGNILSNQFSLEFFNSEPVYVSLAFKAIFDLQNRASQEKQNWGLPEYLRNKYSRDLTVAWKAIDDRLMGKNSVPSP